MNRDHKTHLKRNWKYLKDKNRKNIIGEYHRTRFAKNIKITVINKKTKAVMKNLKNAELRK